MVARVPHGDLEYALRILIRAAGQERRTLCMPSTAGRRPPSAPDPRSLPRPGREPWSTPPAPTIRCDTVTRERLNPAALTEVLVGNTAPAPSMCPRYMPHRGIDPSPHLRQPSSRSDRGSADTGGGLRELTPRGLPASQSHATRTWTSSLAGHAQAMGSGTARVQLGCGPVHHRAPRRKGFT